MTITHYEQPTSEVELPVASPASALVEWAQAADAASRIAETFARSSFVPDSYKYVTQKGDKIPRPVEIVVVEVAAAILAGSEVGLSPITAMRAFDVISGQAAPRAITLRALTQAAGHEIVVDESTETRAKVRGRRRGEDEWQTSTWTIDRARKLGLTNKKNWQAQPQAMLVARATAEVCRWVGSDAILGLAYTVEELDDNTPAPIDAAPATVKRSTTKRATPVRSAPASQGEPPALEAPDLPPLPGEEEEPPSRVGAETTTPAPTPGEETQAVDVLTDMFGEPLRQVEETETQTAETVEPATEKQLRKLGAMFSEIGVKDRDERLDYVRTWTHGNITSAKDLTKNEASHVIEMLGKEIEREAGGQS